MTNEEFEGHLLAALHGPNAEAIARRVVEVSGILSSVAEITTAIADLEIIVAAMNATNLPGDVSEMLMRQMKIDALRKLALGRLRASLADSFAAKTYPEEAREFMAMLGVELP